MQLKRLPKPSLQDRKLKCDRCRKKTKYTLDYAQHADSHAVPGLCCAECRDEVLE